MRRSGTAFASDERPSAHRTGRAPSRNGKGPTWSRPLPTNDGSGRPLRLATHAALFVLDGPTAADVGGSRLLGAGLVGPFLDAPGDDDAADHHEDGEEKLNGFREGPEGDGEIGNDHGEPPALRCFDG